MGIETPLRDSSQLSTPIYSQLALGICVATNALGNTQTDFVLGCWKLGTALLTIKYQFLRLWL